MHKFPEAVALLKGKEPQVHQLNFQETPVITREELETIHTPAYLDAIKHGTLSQYEVNRIGLPQHPNLYRRSGFGASGTLAAARHALSHQYACNLAGGTHHAFPERGHGFCVFNDVAIAIKILQQDNPEMQFLVVDTDAHQGNGTHSIFQNDPSVFTYSIHVGKNFPAKKEPGDCDVPLPRYANADTYFDALDSTLESAFAQSEPDFVFWISGADVHKDDRFGQLQLSFDDIAKRDRHVLKLVHSYQARAVVLYGGGYNRQPGLTSAIHAQTIRLSAEILI
ncbi:MAG: histone deacetylase [Opitutales bacterium]